MKQQNGTQSDGLEQQDRPGQGSVKSYSYSSLIGLSLLYNQLKLNPTKCQAQQICFMRDPPPHPDLKLGQSVLAFVSTAKVLGVWLQNDLKWDTQVSYMNKNAAKRLVMLCSLNRSGFNKSELVTVYKGYIRPLLEYSDVIWHSSLTSNQAHQLER